MLSSRVSTVEVRSLGIAHLLQQISNRLVVTSGSPILLLKTYYVEVV